MTEKETAQMLAVMQAAWPRFYAGSGGEQARAALRIWHAALREEQPALVTAALEDLIKSSPFPPTVADICSRIRAWREAGEPGAAEAFAALKKAAKRGIYNAEEEYGRLPGACREFLGGPSGLRDLAMVDEQVLETVTRGQFIKQYDVLREKRRLRAELPEGVRALIEGVGKELPGIGEGEI